RPRAQDVFLDRRLDPPHGISCKPETLVRLKTFDRLHQADIAFRNHLGDRQAVAAIAHGDLGDEAQMTVDELVCRLMVAVLPPALGKHEFVLRSQHRDPPDFLKIAGDAGFGRHPLIRGRQPSHDLNRISLSRSTTFETQLSASIPIVNLISKRYYLVEADHVSTRNGRAPAAGGAACASRGL